MANPVGSFIWYELMTSDIDAATAFYGAVIGWRITPGGVTDTGVDYRMIGRDDGGHAGGALALSAAMIANGARPGWLGYIHVSDVDAEVDKILGEGGAVHMPAITMDGVGRMAMVADPQGVPFYLMTPQPPTDAPDAVSDVFTVDRPQTVRWNELVATDDLAAVDFYTRHFGWTQQGAMPMGELGDYRFIQCDSVAIGAIMKKADFMPKAGWSFYIGVPDIDAAVAAVKSGGGQLLGEPMEIPGGEFSAHAIDPQGAFFGLVGPRHA